MATLLTWTIASQAFAHLRRAAFRRPHIVTASWPSMLAAGLG
ncbi:MAG TPA: hypothetical protein VGM83_21250 [Devosiaceae bacterium]|jgi:hypothetical protein